MSDPNQPDDVTSGSNVVNPPDTGRQGPTTRQQSTVDAMAQAAAAAAAAQAAANRAQAASQGAQSATASIDYHSLATAMSRLNDDSASNIEKETQPKWDFKVETFVDWQDKVEIWAESHDVKHLLEHPPIADPIQLRKHEVAKRVILLTLPNQDRAYVKGSVTLSEIWGKLLAKYMPSTDTEARRLCSRFSALRQAGRPMVEHVNECMTVRNQLMAVGETVPEEQFIDKVLNIDRELSHLGPMLVRAPIDDIVAGLTDGYSYHYQDRQHHHQHGNAGRGSFQRRHPRGQGAPAAAVDAPAMAAVNAGAGEEERRCYNCNQPGHLREDCDKLHPEVRQWLKQQAARCRGRGRGRSRGRGRAGPAVAAISTTDVQHMVDSLPGESSAFLPDKWLIDSGADLNIFFIYELFSYIGPSDVDICTPIGSTPLDVLGRGVVKMCVEHYVDHTGLSHPIDLEIEDVYWVPQCPMNVLATPCIAEQNMYLCTGPRGNELYMPGFADQSLGVCKCTQEMDHDGNPVIVFNLGKGRPIMHTHPADDGRVWSHVSDVLHNNDAACEIAAVQNEGMAMCYTQNIVPSSALQRELKKEKKEQLEKKVKKDGEEGSTPGEQGDAAAQAAAELLEVPFRDMIPYLAFHRDTSDEYFKQLVGQLKPWGVPVFVYHRRDNMRHLQTRSQKGFCMGPGSGPSMDRVFLKNGGSGTAKQFRHVLVPPAFAQ